MVVLRAAALVLTLASLTVLLAGCTGNAVTVAGQGYSTGGQTRTLACGDAAHIALGIQGAGKMAVTVLDGQRGVVYQNGNLGAGQDGDAQRLQGEAGTWTLKVSTGLGYSGQYGITLSC